MLFARLHHLEARFYDTADTGDLVVVQGAAQLSNGSLVREGSEGR